MDAVDRREFLKLGIGAAASLAACQRLPVRHAIPYLIPPEEVTPGVAVHYAGTCTACPAACGLIATVRDGRPVKLEGNPAHPSSQGGLCAVGQADLRALYDSARLRGPTIGGKAARWPELDAFVRDGLDVARRKGGRVVVLSPTLASPTARQAVADFLPPLGGTLVEHDPDPGSPSAILESCEALHGRPLAPTLDVTKADLLVVLGADPLGTGPDPVAFTAGYSARRRAREERGAFRHVQIEGSLSLTGAAADERWPATAGERRLVSLWLLRHVAGWTPAAEARALAGLLEGLPPLPPALADRVRRLAEDLAAHRGRSLILSGANDLVEQLAVALGNRLLGNDGQTLDPARPSLLRRGLDRDLIALLESLDAGEVGALIVLGLDPVDQLPEGEAFRKAMTRLDLAVAITDRPTATVAACHAVAAAHHGLESWGDFQPRPGVLTLTQPMIRPLFDTRPAFENFLHWSGAKITDSRLCLMDRWRRDVFPQAGSPDFTAFWTRAVADGRAPDDVAERAGSVEAATATADGALSALRKALDGALLAPGDGIEAELLSEVALRDGSRAHVPWLRELPDPLTRVAWTPCVRVAPERAAGLSLRDGDVVTVTVGERSVTLPVRVLPGQHPRVLGLPVGYGRVDGDGGDDARNAYRLARAVAGRIQRQGLAATLRPAGRREALPVAQAQSDTAGRPVVLQVFAPDERAHGSHRPEGRDLWPEEPASSPQWEMVIDLDACTGCGACVVACQAENNIPVVGPDEVRRNREMHWLRIDRYFAGSPEGPDVLFEPVLCAQCGHAPCETVCPVAATVHSEDGLNQQVYNRCVGTRYCANNCPYKVRRFNWFDYEMKQPLERMALNPDVVVRSRGVMEKCTFCVQRIQAARIAARAEGRQGVPEVRTACQQSCPARAIAFGDGSDPKGPIARLKSRPRAFQVLADLGIQPKVTYLARVRNRETEAPHGGKA